MSLSSPKRTSRTYITIRWTQSLHLAPTWYVPGAIVKTCFIHRWFLGYFVASPRTFGRTKTTTQLPATGRRWHRAVPCPEHPCRHQRGELAACLGGGTRASDQGGHGRASRHGDDGERQPLQNTSNRDFFCATVLEPVAVKKGWLGSTIALKTLFHRLGGGD